MKNFYWEFSRAHRLEVSVGLLVAVVIGVLAIVKKKNRRQSGHVANNNRYDRECFCRR